VSSVLFQQVSASSTISKSQVAPLYSAKLSSSPAKAPDPVPTIYLSPVVGLSGGASVKSITASFQCNPSKRLRTWSHLGTAELAVALLFYCHFVQTLVSL